MRGFEHPTQDFPVPALPVWATRRYQLELALLFLVSSEYLLFERYAGFLRLSSTFFTPVIDRQYLYIVVLLKGLGLRKKALWSWD